MPTPIFTFANEDEGTSQVTGTNRDLEKILEKLVMKVTGYNRNDVDSVIFRRAVEILTRRDKRLVVPFIREGHLPSGALMMTLTDQIETYGGFSVETAAEFILGLV